MTTDIEAEAAARGENNAALIAALNRTGLGEVESSWELDVINDAERGRWVGTLGAEAIAELSYRFVGGRVVLLTTWVDRAYRQNRVATELIARVLDEIRRTGKKVTIICPVVGHFMARHRRYLDLIDPGHPGPGAYPHQEPPPEQQLSAFEGEPSRPVSPGRVSTVSQSEAAPSASADGRPDGSGRVGSVLRGTGAVGHRPRRKDEHCEARLGAKRFHLQRREDVSGQTGVGTVAEGILFPCGKVALCWVSPPHAVAVYDRIADVEQVHGHDGRTVVVFQKFEADMPPSDGAGTPIPLVSVRPQQPTPASRKSFRGSTPAGEASRSAFVAGS